MNIANKVKNCSGSKKFKICNQANLFYYSTLTHQKLMIYFEPQKSVQRANTLNDLPSEFVK